MHAAQTCFTCCAIDCLRSALLVNLTTPLPTPPHPRARAYTHTHTHTQAHTHTHTHTQKRYSSPASAVHTEIPALAGSLREAENVPLLKQPFWRKLKRPVLMRATIHDPSPYNLASRWPKREARALVTSSYEHARAPGDGTNYRQACSRIGPEPDAHLRICQFHRP